MPSCEHAQMPKRTKEKIKKEASNKSFVVCCVFGVYSVFTSFFILLFYSLVQNRKRHGDKATQYAHRHTHKICGGSLLSVVIKTHTDAK